MHVAIYIYNKALVVEAVLKSWKIKTIQKIVTKFTTLICNNSSYMYLYHLIYYNCPKYSQHTLNQWRYFTTMRCSAFCTLFSLLILLDSAKVRTRKKCKIKLGLAHNHFSRLLALFPGDFLPLVSLSCIGTTLRENEGEERKLSLYRTTLSCCDSVSRTV